MKATVKLLIFMEMLTFFTIGLGHFFFSIATDEVFPLEIYWILPLAVLAACLFCIYILIPFAEWFFSD